METRLVAFFDLLGFSSIIRSSTDETHRQEKILRLLSQLVEDEGDYTYTSVLADDNNTRHTVRPAISAFSDNIVFSIPIDDDVIGSGPFIFLFANFAADFFHQAIQVGCLVRGGITVGRLYHKNQVVFGPALVEAYELESKTAKFPRILISPSAMDYIVQNPFVQIDDDGCSCLDYLGCSFSTGKQLSEFHGDTFSKTRWDYFEKLIANGILNLTASDNSRGLENWQWLQSSWKRLESKILARR